MRMFASIALVAGAATLGDFIWYAAGVHHTVAAGVLHGMLLLTVVGAVLGAASGRLVKGLPIGAIAGLGGALGYYLLIAVLDSRTYGPAIPGAWVVMWLLLATLDGRWLRTPGERRWSEVAVRGIAAAVAAGLAFALVRDVLWGRAAGEDRNYVVQFAAWAVAWAPGLLALTWDITGAGSAGASSHAASISPTELLAAIDRGETCHVLDVRSDGEYAWGHVPGAVNIPFHQIPFRLADVPGSREETLILYCGHGPRAYMAAAALRSHRAHILYMAGHFAAWQRAGLRVEPPAQSTRR